MVVKFKAKPLVIALLLVVSNFVNADEVTINERQILLNGSVYIIKGVCYNPVAKGSSDRTWETLTADLAIMNEADINTIRVYSPIDEKEVLDEIHAAGIKVIIGFGYNMNGYYDILSGTYLDYITKYKNHDAILLWEFGNEYNYHPEWFDNDINNWYNALEEAAQEAHWEDENHPTATAHGEIPNSVALNKCKNIDVWGMNVYRWDNPSDIFSEWSNLSSLPMYLSEAGADSYMKAAMNGYEQGENELAQADATRNILNSIFNNQDICSGVALFEFSDEWWKAGNPNAHDVGGWAPNSSGVPYDGAPNEEYWGIVDIDRNKKEAFEVVKTKYSSIQVDIDQVGDIGLQIHPTVVTNTVQIIGATECNIVVFNINGMVLKTINAAQKGRVTINTTDWPRGLYLVQCVNNSKTTLGKIVKH